MLHGHAAPWGARKMTRRRVCVWVGWGGVWGRGAGVRRRVRRLLTSCCALSMALVTAGLWETSEKKEKTKGSASSPYTNLQPQGQAK